MKIEDKNEPRLDGNTNEPEKAIDTVKRYEDVLKDQNKQIINMLGKQRKLLKRFKESDGFFDNVVLSRYHVYAAFKLKQIYTDSKYIRIHIKTIKLKTGKYIYVSNYLH